MAADELGQLRQLVAQTFAPDRATRQQAENSLQSFEHQPGFPPLLLRLIEVHCAGTTAEDKNVRQAASVYFKNMIKRCWEPEDEDGKENAIGDQDKTIIKSHMVNYMCTTPPEVQRQLSEALSIISKSDFPAKWETLLPELVSKFSVDNFHVTNGVLVTANSIMKRFRYGFKSDKLYAELKYCLEHLQVPLLQLFQATTERVKAVSAEPQGSPDVYRKLMPMLEALRTMARIFFSLNWQDIPEFFEDHIGDWMPMFLGFLSYENATVTDPDEDSEPGPIDKLQTAIVEIASLYAEKYEEEFQSQLPDFAQTIWGLLVKLTPATKFDQLASTSIRFLTSVVSKQHYRSLFQSQESLQQIVQQIVVPNLMLRESDVELFEDNPAEWIQRDMEGSDSETRRRCACELIRGMCKQFEAETTTICGSYMGNLLQEYNNDRANRWQAKDAAILLLVSISVKAQTAATGASKTNEAINVMEMMVAHVLPELQDVRNVNERPILRADAIKFVCTFRRQVPVETLKAMMPLLVAHLKAESVVVQSYAANCIERILTIKDKVQGAPAVPRFTRTELAPILASLFDGLFAVLSSTDEEIFENEYVMKATMRVLHVAREDLVQHTPVVLGSLNGVLERVCKNPRNPQFNHFLFESIAVLVRAACGSNPAMSSQFEQLLFPPFQTVLQMDVQEFSPYVFQILAQLLEYRPDGLSDAYRALFEPLLVPTNWERKGNCPALVRLLQAYLKQDRNQELAPHMTALLGIFQKLLALKSTENSAFLLLESILSTYTQAIEQFLPQLFQLLMTRLQQNQTARFARLLVLFLSQLILKKGSAMLVQCLEQVQPGLLGMVINQVWIRAIDTSPPEYHEAKVCAMGMATLLVQCDQIKADAATWTNLLNSTISILAPCTRSGGGNDDDVEERIGFDGDAYSKLHFASSDQDKKDPLPDVVDVPTTVVQMLGTLCQASPGRFLPMLQQLNPDKSKALQEACSKAGVALV